jgi:hypothetical protein
MRSNTKNDIIDIIHPRRLYNNLVKLLVRRGRKGNLQDHPVEQEQAQKQEWEQEWKQEQDHKQKQK